MTTLTIFNDKITSVPIIFLNAAGSGVAAPAGDMCSVTSSSASLGAFVGGAAGAPTVVLTPAVRAGTGYVVTVSDANGLSATLIVAITADPTIPAQIAFGAATSTVAQSIPTAPGP